jgi:4-hydroxybenzoate polyprenyltransferase
MKKAKENISLLVTVTITVALLVIADRYGLSHKWQTAIFGTMVPFWALVAVYPLRWRRWSFWAAFAICLAIHTVAIWGFFQYLVGSMTPGLLLWTPIAFVEAFVLMAVVKRLEEALTGKRKKNHVVRESYH